MNTISAQNWEEEIGFMYTKASYLVETERYDEAIKELTLVINKNPGYKDALYSRAISKFKLGAYKSAKKDLLLSVELNGLEPRTAKLLALSDLRMGNDTAAINSLLSAEKLTGGDDEIYYELGNYYFEKSNEPKACNYWSSASESGNINARKKITRYCSKVASSTQYVDTENDDIVENDPYELEEEIVEQKPKTKKKKKPVIEEEENDLVYFDAREKEEEEIDSDLNEDPMEDTDNINTIEIDEDLNIKITGNGLGSRRVLKKPNVLILSEISGTVVIDVCVNRSGRIIETTLNKEISTIEKQSLISLALRKSKDFWFAKSKEKEQCGFIIFDIIGS